MNKYNSEVEDRISLKGLFVGFLEGIALLAMFGAIAYPVITLWHLEVIKKEGFTSDRNFGNAWALHIAEESGLRPVIVSELPVEEATRFMAAQDDRPRYDGE